MASLVDACVKSMVASEVRDPNDRDPLYKGKLPIPSLKAQRLHLRNTVNRHEIPEQLRQDILDNRFIYMRTKKMVTCFACDVELPLLQSLVVTAHHNRKSPHARDYTATCMPYLYASGRAIVYRPPQVDLHACDVCAESGAVMGKIELHYQKELALHPVESDDSSSDEEEEIFSADEQDLEELVKKENKK